MDDEMKVIHHFERVLDDGSTMTCTIKTSGGAAISEEDKEFLRRFLPLSAGAALDAAAGEE